MTEQQNNETFDLVRLLINVLGVVITAGVVALVVATILVET